MIISTRRFRMHLMRNMGYLTSYPTNVGTAMKASVVVHLPSLTMNKKFQELLGDMGRFGTTVRGVYGRGNENYGDLVRGSQSEDTRHHRTRDSGAGGQRGGQLSAQENQFREVFCRGTAWSGRMRAYKSYGVLKYARRMTLKEAMTFLSHVWAGIADGLLKTGGILSIYRLMIGIQPANLQKRSSKPLGREELEAERARYLREELPKLV